MQLSLVHLLFVIIIIIAACADTLTMPVAIGLIMAAILLFAGMGGVCVEEPRESAEAGKSTSTPATDAYTDMNKYDDDVPWQNQSVLNYNQSSIEHHALNASYGMCYDTPRPVIGNSGAEIDGSIDSQLSLMSQQRQRDKKRSDGWALKDADYFRHNYDWELDDYENKPWWGRSEY
jgi:hypothetical protein